MPRTHAPTCVRARTRTVGTLHTQPIEAVAALRGEEGRPGFVAMDFDPESCDLEEPWYFQFKTDRALKCFAVAVNEHWRDLYQVDLLVDGIILD